MSLYHFLALVSTAAIVRLSHKACTVLDHIKQLVPNKNPTEEIDLAQFQAFQSTFD